VIHLYGISERRAAAGVQDFYPDIDGLAFAESRNAPDSELLPPVAVNTAGVICGSVALGHSYSTVTHSTPLAIPAPTPDDTTAIAQGTHQSNPQGPAGRAQELVRTCKSVSRTADCLAVITNPNPITPNRGVLEIRSRDAIPVSVTPLNSLPDSAR
jgi:hypothetical protein